MNEEKKIEMFRRDAKFLVDELFDQHVFSENLTRDDLQKVEDYISRCMEIHFDSKEFLNSLKKSRPKP